MAQMMQLPEGLFVIFVVVLGRGQEKLAMGASPAISPLLLVAMGHGVQE